MRSEGGVLGTIVNFVMLSCVAMGFRGRLEFNFEVILLLGLLVTGVLLGLSIQAGSMGDKCRISRGPGIDWNMYWVIVV
jgi:hypothetical protein